MEFYCGPDIAVEETPIIPPLITNNITIEIQYYKQLSVAVKKRLDILERIYETSLSKCKDDRIKNNLISEVRNHVQDSDSFISQNLFPNESQNLTNENCNTSVVENDQNNTTSDIVTISTDEYLNTSIFMGKSIGSMPENWKPQVPKTLDIIPITLDNLKAIDSTTTNDKMIYKQSSYVLEVLSPIIFTHLQNKMIDIKYSPTSIQILDFKDNKVKREEESQVNSKKSLLSNKYSVKKLKKILKSYKCQRKSQSVSNSKSNSLLNLYKSTKSLDSIQDTLYNKDCFHTDIFKINKDSNYRLRNNDIKELKNSNKLNRSPSISNLSIQLSKSLEYLNKPSYVEQVDRRITKDSDTNVCIDQPSLDVHSLTDLKKSKPTITSDKIISVFKEIQDNHKKQMTELIDRQQKEQMLMHENCKKQQIFFLAQIRKAFPDVSISILLEAIAGKSENISKSLILNTKSQVIEKQKCEKKVVDNINYYKDKRCIQNISMDYTKHSKELLSTSCHLTIQPTTPINHCQNNFEDNTFVENFSSILNSPRHSLINPSTYDTPPKNSTLKTHDVKQELFLVDKIKASFLANCTYTAKHVKAATLINAYARGFLVRRLMKTDKIIALKNTYREALHCMLRLHIDAPLNLPELNFHQRLQLQINVLVDSVLYLRSTNH